MRIHDISSLLPKCTAAPDLRMERIDLPAYGAFAVAAAIVPRLGINLVTITDPVIYSRGSETRLYFDGSAAGLSSEQGSIRTAPVVDVLELEWGGDRRERIYGTITNILINQRTSRTKLYFTEREIWRFPFMLGDV